MQVAQQVLDGGDQGGSVGATTGSVGVIAGSDNGEANWAGSMSGLGSLAATRWTQNKGLGNGYRLGKPSRSTTVTCFGVIVVGYIVLLLFLIRWSCDGHPP
jgi:hypothetical protein